MQIRDEIELRNVLANSYGIKRRIKVVSEKGKAIFDDEEGYQKRKNHKRKHRHHYHSRSKRRSHHHHHKSGSAEEVSTLVAIRESPPQQKKKLKHKLTVPLVCEKRVFLARIIFTQ